MKYLWRVLLILTASTMIMGCVSQSKFRNLEASYNQLQSEFQGNQLELRERRIQVVNLEERLAEARKNNNNLQKFLNQSLTQGSQGNMNIARLIEEINASNRFIQHLVQVKNRSDSLNIVMINNLTRSLTREEMQNMDIQVLKGVVYISLADNMLYRSGSFEISPESGKILSKIAKIILDYKDYSVLVEGNTDSVPISRPNIRNNWDLSTLRASSVVQALQNNYGVDPIRLTAAGRGEYNPIASNATEEGRARNRRTQIIITPKLDQFMELIDQAPRTSLNED